MDSFNKPSEEFSNYDFWDELPAEVKIAIEQAKDELDRGQGIPHADVMADMKNRFLTK